MIVYHGTTLSRANRIRAEGFLAKTPSRRVWFAKHKGYALRRARHKAQRANDTPVVLQCDLCIDTLRRTLGPRHVRVSGSVVAVDGPVPPTVLTGPRPPVVPSRHDQLRVWVNQLLGFAPHEGVGVNDPGLDRLARWLDQRIASNPGGDLKKEELLEVGAQCMPELFQRGRPDFGRVSRPPGSADHEGTEDAVDEAETDHGSPDEALALLESEGPSLRAKGIGLLAKAEDPDLFEWCALMLDDESAEVKVAALQAMLVCEEIEDAVVKAFVDAEDKVLRAAAVAVLARHSAEDQEGWFRYGLTDPEPHVRVATARQLGHLVPSEHQAIFDLALHDGNAQVVRMAKRLLRS